jgi:hypothetical protein
MACEYLKPLLVLRDKILLGGITLSKIRSLIRCCETPELISVVRPGRDNPLGSAALYLSKPPYLVHGTQDSWEVGTAETDSCVELRNEDALTLYRTLQKGDLVTIIRPSSIFGFVKGLLYLEVGPYFSGNNRNNVVRLGELEAKLRGRKFIEEVEVTLRRQFGKTYRLMIDEAALEKAFTLGLGYPIIVGSLSPSGR